MEQTARDVQAPLQPAESVSQARANGPADRPGQPPVDPLFQCGTVPPYNSAEGLEFSARQTIVETPVPGADADLRPLSRGASVRPKTAIVPASRRSRPATALIIVVLPAPFGPNQRRGTRPRRPREAPARRGDGAKALVAPEIASGVPAGIDVIAAVLGSCVGAPHAKSYGRGPPRSVVSVNGGKRRS